MTQKAVFGIDLWHAVEFSSYGCALAFHAKKRNLLGQRPNLLQACAQGQIEFALGVNLDKSGFSTVRTRYLRLKRLPCPFHCKERNYTDERK